MGRISMEAGTAKLQRGKYTGGRHRNRNCGAIWGKSQCSSEFKYRMERISKQMLMQCHRKIHLEWLQGSTDCVCGLRNIKTGGFDRVRGNVELGLVIKERLRDRY